MKDILTLLTAHINLKVPEDGSVLFNADVWTDSRELQQVLTVIYITEQHKLGRDVELKSQELKSDTKPQLKETSLQVV